MHPNRNNKLVAKNRWKNVRKKIRKYISENSEKTKVNKSRILGYLAGDGSVFRYIDRNNEEYFGISFFPDNLCVAKTYVDDMSKVYGVVLKIKEEKNHYNISIKNRVIYKELMSIGSYGNLDWKVPFKFLDTEQMKKEWLRSFFDCEAYVGKNVIQVQSVNESGLNQVMGCYLDWV